MKRSDMPFEIDFNDTPHEKLTELCVCGHVALAHGRASWACTAVKCRCKGFSPGSDMLHVTPCRKGHYDIAPNGQCRRCHAEYQAQYRARKKAKAAREIEQPPGTFDYKGERFTEGATWAMLRKHGWAGERKATPIVYCSVHGCGEPSISVPLCSTHTISPNA